MRPYSTLKWPFLFALLIKERRPRQGVDAIIFTNGEKSMSIDQDILCSRFRLRVVTCVSRLCVSWLAFPFTPRISVQGRFVRSGLGFAACPSPWALALRFTACACAEPLPVSHRRFRSRLRFVAVGILCPRSCFRPFRLRVIFLVSIRVNTAWPIVLSMVPVIRLSTCAGI